MAAAPAAPPAGAGPATVESVLFGASGGRSIDLQIAVEQYFTFVDMADRIGARRQTANSFFLSINTALLTAIGYLVLKTLDARHAIPSLAALSALAAFVSLLANYLWHRTLLYYRGLLRAKFEVIDRIETVLPLKPYAAEWVALTGPKGDGYKPLSDLEARIPILLAVIALLVLAVSLYFALS
jgi:hypothetical protein